MAEFCLCLDLLSESPKILFRKIKKGLYLKQEKSLWLCSVSVKHVRCLYSFFSLAIFKKSEGDIPVMRLKVTVKLLRELKPRLAAMASMVK